MTRNDTDGRARRGYLIIIGLLIAAVLIFNIDAVQDLTSDRADLVALLPDASGVRVGTPVWVAGVESGTITGIDFLASGGNAQIALTLRIASEALAVIRRDSDVRAIRLRLIGQPVVQVEAGTAAAPAARSGDTLLAHPRVDTDLLLAEGTRLPAQLDSLLTSARQVAGMARSRSHDLERLQVRIDAVTSAAGVLSTELEGGSLGRFMEPGGLDPVARLGARLDSLGAELGAAIERYSGAEGEEASLPRSLQSLRARVAALRADLAVFNARFRAGGGTLDRLARDSALQVAVRRVQAQVDTLRQEAASIALRMVHP